MADRPWVHPDEVRSYSEDKLVQERSYIRLEFDIARAEAQIIKYCNNKFMDCDVIPNDVKTATILLAEKYAYTSAHIKKKGILSETFDDYSYSADAGAYDIDIANLGLESLLDIYKKSKGSINFNLWGL